MPQTFLTPIVIFLAVIFCFVVLFIGDFSIFFLGALVPPLLMSCARIDLWVMAILMCHLSTLRLPGMPGQIQLFHLMIIVMVVLSVIRNMTVHVTPRITWPKFWGFAFMVLMLVLMWQRGSGFRQLGSNMWGGSVYIHLITTALFFLFADQTSFTARTWRRIFYVMFGLATLPAVSEFTLTMSGGTVTWHSIFIQPRAISADSLAGSPSDQVTRFQSLIALTPLFLLPFLMVPFTGKHRKWFFVAILSVIVVGGLSGHRMVLVLITLTVWVHMFFHVRNKITFIMASLLLTASAVLIIGQLAPLLPKPHQRMLSIIPFANIADDVSRDASSTVTWRLNVWREAIHMIPRYLWLGKGFAYEVNELLSQAAIYSEAYAIRWALVQTAFHQGILSLLIGTGLPGLVIGLGFLLGTCIRHFRFTRRKWSDTALQRMHMAIFSYFVSLTISYIFIYGDAHRSFPTLFIYAAILESLKASDLKAQSALLAEEPRSPAAMGPAMQPAFEKPLSGHQLQPPRRAR